MVDGLVSIAGLDHRLLYYNERHPIIGKSMDESIHFMISLTMPLIDPNLDNDHLHLVDQC